MRQFNVPNLEESKEIIINNAIRIARKILSDKGLEFKEPSNIEEARALIEECFKFQPKNQYDYLIMIALLLQSISYWYELNISGEEISRDLIKMGEQVWDQGISDATYYQLAAGLDPDNFKAVHETISVFVQGRKKRPREALPYAVLVDHLEPARHEVDFILSEIKELEEHEKALDKINPQCKFCGHRFKLDEDIMYIAVRNIEMKRSCENDERLKITCPRCDKSFCYNPLEYI